MKDKLLISAPNYSLLVHSDLITTSSIISEVVGDVERLIKYPEYGFQIKQDVPQNVFDAYVRLKANGYTEHCLSLI